MRLYRVVLGHFSPQRGVLASPEPQEHREPSEKKCPRVNSRVGILKINSFLQKFPFFPLILTFFPIFAHFSAKRGVLASPDPQEDPKPGKQIFPRVNSRVGNPKKFFFPQKSPSFPSIFTFLPHFLTNFDPRFSQNSPKMAFSCENFDIFGYFRG